MSGRSGVRSSLPYQLLLYCNAWYFGLFFLLELLLFIYKAETLPYPKSNLAAEIILVLVLAGVEAIRNFFGQKGNLTETMAPVLISVLLSIPCFVTMAYLLFWQTYVLMLEVVLVSIQMVFLILQLIFGLVAVAIFARAAPI